MTQTKPKRKPQRHAVSFRLPDHLSRYVARAAQIANMDEDDVYTVVLALKLAALERSGAFGQRAKHKG